MANERKQLRGTVLAEDPRTESFFRKLLVHLGFDQNRLRFRTAPKGRGSASAWICAQYPGEVKLLRQKRHQLGLFLIAVCDGDHDGFVHRQASLGDALRVAQLDQRQKNERIATPVPTWSIETWLLALLGDDSVDENEKQKWNFEKRYPQKEEQQALCDAAQAWRNRADQVHPYRPSRMAKLNWEGSMPLEVVLGRRTAQAAPVNLIIDRRSTLESACQACAPSRTCIRILE